MAKKQKSTTESSSAVRAGNKYYCKVNAHGRMEPVICETEEAKSFAEGLGKLLQGIAACVFDIRPASSDEFVNFIELTDLPQLTAAFGEDAEAFCLACTNRLEVDEIHAEQMSSFLESFVYSAEDFRYEDSGYGVWLSPNLPTAMTDIDSLMNELAADADKWRTISRMMQQPKNKLAKSIEIAAGEDLKKDVKSLERLFGRFAQYEIVEE